MKIKLELIKYENIIFERQLTHKISSRVLRNFPLIVGFWQHVFAAPTSCQNRDLTVYV